MTQQIDPGVHTVVHLMRHGEVYNPEGVLYGRLPDYHLSDLGRKMAERGAEFFAERDVVHVAAEPVLLIASSDMNHYENDTVTRVKDHKAIERILVMDAHGLYNVVMNEDISMCGFGPTVAMLTAATRLGATGTELVRYATSGDVSGDRERVVGYAGILVR